MKGRLRNADGVVVENDKKADILAEYFETVQWRVRPLSDVGVTEVLGPLLNVTLDRINLGELQAMSKKTQIGESLWCR